MASEQASKRRPLVWYGLFVAPAFVGLAGVLIAIGRGHSSARLWPVAAFLTLWALSAAYVSIARRAFRQRIARQRKAPVRRGVRLATPVWIRLDSALTFTGLCAILGTVVASFGFPGIAVGVLLVLVGLVVVGGITTGFSIAGVRALTFEESGLRFYPRGAECLAPWSAIGAVQCIGPDHFTMVRVDIIDLDEMLRSASPTTRRALARARAAFGQGYVLLQPWTAGIEGQTLARAIDEGRRGVGEPVN